MKAVPIYDISCPNGHTISLPETILGKIVQHLILSARGKPLLNFVCTQCKTAFHFDYQNRQPAGETEEPRQLSEFQICIATTGCSSSNCIVPVELIAVRSCLWNETHFSLDLQGPERTILPIGAPPAFGLSRSWIIKSLTQKAVEGILICCLFSYLPSASLLGSLQNRLHAFALP